MRKGTMPRQAGLPDGTGGCGAGGAATRTLEIHSLKRSYGGSTALDGLSFMVKPGTVTGFLGPNGAGKTTTMRAIFGLTDLDGGSISWGGLPVGPAERRRFGYMPEERGLYPGMRVEEQLQYLGRLHRMDAPAAKAATRLWLERLEIDRWSGSKVETLSHGNQQRVQLAAALVHNPELLVLDEPLSGLDPLGIEAIGSVLTDRARDGCGVLFSSHQLDQVEELCDEVVIIDHGRLVASGTVDELESTGPRRLVVRIDGARDANWALAIEGVSVSESTKGTSRLLLADSVDGDDVLRAAMESGTVTYYAYERRKLSEVFREALG